MLARDFPALSRVFRQLPAGLRRSTSAWTVLAALSPIVLALAIGRLTAVVATGESARWALVFVAAGLVLGRVSDTIAGYKGDLVGRETTRLTELGIIKSASIGPTVERFHDQAFLDDLATAQGLGLNPTGVSWGVRGLLGVTSFRLQGLLALGVLCWLSPLAALVLVIGHVVSYRPIRRWFMGMAECVGSAQEDIRQLDYLRQLALSSRAGKELRVFQFGPWLVTRYLTAYRATFTAIWAQRQSLSRRVLVPLLFQSVFPVISLWLVSHQALRGSLTLGGATAAIQLVLASAHLTSLDDNLVAAAWGEIGAKAAERAGADVQSEKTADQPRMDQGQVLESTASPALISLRNVSFCYPGRDLPVLDRVSLDLAPGASLGVVGPNGAGKSTLLRIIAGTYSCTSGCVYRGKDETGRALKIAVVEQRPMRLDSGTIADNVAIGRVDLRGDEEGIREALRRTGLLAFVDSLPQGANTPVGTQFAGGIDLSGGQWQRLAISRAVFSVIHGANLVLLDEPVASLSTAAESALFSQMLTLDRTVAIIAVSHRYTTVAGLDKIAVVDDGRVVEYGSHQELISSGGYYDRGFRLQAVRYS